MVIKSKSCKSNWRPVGQELLICKICLQPFLPQKNPPKKLECSHVFCKECLEKFLFKKKSTLQYTCPLCKVITICPQNTGLEDDQLCLQAISSSIQKEFNHSKKNLDPVEANFEFYGVAPSKRVVVKASNHRLHPFPKTNEDEDFDKPQNSAFQIKDTSKSELINQRFSSAIKYPSNKLENLFGPRGDSLHQNMADCILMELKEQKNETLKSQSKKSTCQSKIGKSSCKTGVSTRPGYSPNPIYSQMDSSRRKGKETEDDDDLDWNYFTQTSSLGSKYDTPEEHFHPIQELPDEEDPKPENNFSSEPFVTKVITEPPEEGYGVLHGEMKIIPDKEEEGTIIGFSNIPQDDFGLDSFNLTSHQAAKFHGSNPLANPFFPEKPKSPYTGVVSYFQE